jgi:hypothetical protein
MAGQERRLWNVLRLEVATPDMVLDEISQMKKEREVVKRDLPALQKQEITSTKQ